MAELIKAAQNGDVAGATKALANGEDVNAADSSVRRFPSFFLSSLLPSFVGGWGLLPSPAWHWTQ